MVMLEENTCSSSTITDDTVSWPSAEAAFIALITFPLSRNKGTNDDT